MYDSEIVNRMVQIEIGRMDGWMVGWMDGRMDGWMDEWMVGWIDGCMDRQIDYLSCWGVTKYPITYQK